MYLIWFVFTLLWAAQSGFFFFFQYRIPKTTGPFKQKICSEHCEHGHALANSVTSTMLCERLSAGAEMVWVDSKKCVKIHFFPVSVRNSNYESQTLCPHCLYQLQIDQCASIWPMLDETWEKFSQIHNLKTENLSNLSIIFFQVKRVCVLHYFNHILTPNYNILPTN